MPGICRAGHRHPPLTASQSSFDNVMVKSIAFDVDSSTRYRKPCVTNVQLPSGPEAIAFVLHSIVVHVKPDRRPPKLTDEDVSRAKMARRGMPDAI